ncbi:MAG: ATP-binding protein [Segetibacter sp.]
MKILILNFIIALLVTTATAQQYKSSQIDSLRKIVDLSGQDTNRVLALQVLASSTTRSYPEMSMKLAQQGLDLSERLEFPKGKALCQHTIAAVLLRSGRNPEAYQILIESLNTFRLINYPRGIFRVTQTLGTFYYGMGDYQKAMSYYIQAKETVKTYNDNFSISLNLKSIGETYFQLNQIDSASKYLNLAYNIQKRNDYRVLLDNVLIVFGQMYAKLGQDEQAMQNLRNGIPYAMYDSDYPTLTDIYIEISRLYLKEGKLDSCIKYARDAESYGGKSLYSKGIMEAKLLLSNAYLGNNPPESYKYFRAATAIKDSLFNAEKGKQVQNLEFVERQRLQTKEDIENEYKNDIKFYSLLAGLAVFLMLAIILYKNNRIKQKANVKLQHQKEEIEITFNKLKSTQSQLIQSEKMASLGELTAGIAHEIQNPLNFVNNFSEVNKELLLEMKDEIDKGHINEVKLIANDLIDNQEKINHHGKRADAIVKGMLQHSRASTGKKEPTDINALADEYLRLSYHGLRAKDKEFNADFKTDFDETIGKIEVVPQDIGRVLLNLYNNAFYAVNEKNKAPTLKGENYNPTVWVTTKRISTPSGAGELEIFVKDNGTGIPQKVFDKIFQPFFTTKPTGQGTGLGLSLSYDIIKAHGGELKVETKEGEGAEFIISIPTNYS